MSQEKDALSLEIKEYISRQDAAELAGVNVSTVTKWMQSGEFLCMIIYCRGTGLLWEEYKCS